MRGSQRWRILCRQEKLCCILFSPGVFRTVRSGWDLDPACIVLLLFGADKLPKLARGLGKSLGEFKKAKEDFEKEIHNAANETDVKPVTDQNRIGGNLPEPVAPVSRIRRLPSTS